MITHTSDPHTASSIQIVDDNPDNLGVLDSVLAGQGYEVRAAINGTLALKAIRKHPPDLILLDIIMPGMDGYEVCRQLKADERTRDIPVIFLSALHDTRDKINAFAVGGVDYVTKPFQEEEVLARVHAHVTIRRQQQQLRALNASKDTFFSLIAHDVKNPCIGFLSFIELLEESAHTWNKKRMIELIALFRTSVEHLSALLDNLLTWSRIQRGMIEHQAQPLGLHLVVARNIALFRPNAEHKQISLSNSIPQHTMASADVNMLDTVLRNLLSNALKFTPTGGTVDVSARHDQQHVEVSVSDTGLGIAEEHLPKLFRIDVQYKRLGTVREKGAGLGLLLCQEFVEKNGARFGLRVTSGRVRHSGLRSHQLLRWTRLEIATRCREKFLS